MRENTALTAWRDGKATIGGWLQLANAHSAEVLASLGFDWLCIDLQHGLIDYRDLTYMLPAIATAGTPPLVRVPWNEPYEIMKALDAGAYGVIVPMVNRISGRTSSRFSRCETAKMRQRSSKLRSTSSRKPA